MRAVEIPQFAQRLACQAQGPLGQGGTRRGDREGEIYRPERAPAGGAGLQGERVDVRWAAAREDLQRPSEGAAPGDFQLVG